MVQPSEHLPLFLQALRTGLGEQLGVGVVNMIVVHPAGSAIVGLAVQPANDSKWVSGIPAEGTV